MNDSTVPSCLSNYGKPTFSNGPCNQCQWEEVCAKSTKMNQKLKAELPEKNDVNLAVVQGADSQ